MEDSGIDSGDHILDGPSKKAESTSDSSSNDESNTRSPARAILPSSWQLQKKSVHARRLNQDVTTALIPIQRLPIPGVKDHEPLVQLDTDDSEDDIVNFFPLSRKGSRVRHELTDTFSIEEMSISGDEEDEDDLHLVPPQTVYKRFGCCPLSFCVIM